MAGSCPADLEPWRCEGNARASKSNLHRQEPDGDVRMYGIQLPVVKNEAARTQKKTERKLLYLLPVGNLALRKRVAVVWAGDQPCQGLHEGLLEFHRP
jgi:hypothetical protein